MGHVGDEAELALLGVFADRVAVSDGRKARNMVLLSSSGDAANLPARIADIQIAERLKVRAGSLVEWRS
jgi:hypothetical protein